MWCLACVLFLLTILRKPLFSLSRFTGLEVAVDVGDPAWAAFAFDDSHSLLLLFTEFVNLFLQLLSVAVGSFVSIYCLGCLRPRRLWLKSLMLQVRYCATVMGSAVLLATL